MTSTRRPQPRDVFSFEDYDNVIGFAISQAADVLARRLAATIDQNGISITPREFAIINRLHQFGSLTLGQIANHTYRDSAATSRLVDSLRKKGMVARKVDTNDRRVTNITLTAKGQSVREIIVPQVSEMLRDVFSGTTSEDLLATLNVMKTISDNAAR
ncbi:putative transcriptional regulator [Caenibius tardaugens NBRC 16725]|uniref:Putative transcriptional regulator n=1 Tax=Caenibius tardaugens NBRC 16725 TaxID=1219035 RepID=U3A0D1_9SPHN|nr:MarR family transcriptional regulator [Caenibius tardaugens]GAD51104.1 putative transcriptional regulator [Caenibius tardaugens NBRC 16725]